MLVAGRSTHCRQSMLRRALLPLCQGSGLELDGLRWVRAFPNAPGYHGGNALLLNISLTHSGGFVFFGAYEKAQELLWKTGSWGKKPQFVM